MLGARVRTGDLPPVAERLPCEPNVVTPREAIGRYGGTMAIAIPGESSTDVKDLVYPNLFSYSPDLQRIEARIARSYTVSDDYRTWTIHLRPGTKWSDGHPLTTDDILFWWEDVEMRDGRAPALYKIDNQPCRIEKVDDSTFRFIFASPNPGFTSWFQGRNNSRLIRFPKHYLKQFHPTYNPNAEQRAREAGFTDWEQYFKYMATDDGWNQNMELPRLFPWLLKRTTPSYQIYERNPYFCQVDTKGNQLPYIDELLVMRCENESMVVTKVAFGQVDLCGAALDITAYPLVKSLEKKSGMRTYLFKSTRSTALGWAFNLNSPDPVKRKVFQDLRFRRAVSLAIDRDEINRIIFYGKAEPRQAAPLPMVVYFKEEWARSYAEHDPQKANRMLDDVGLMWDDNHRWRLGPDGEPFRINFEYANIEGPKTAICELMKDHLADIGINLHLKSRSKSYIHTRHWSKEPDVYAFHIDSPTTYFRSSLLLPYRKGRRGIPGFDWADWLESDGEEGEEPPGDIKRWYRLGQQWRVETDEAKSRKLIQEIFDMQAENLYRIGTVGAEPSPVAYDADLRNVPREGYWGWPLQFWKGYNPAQFFFAVPQEDE